MKRLKISLNLILLLLLILGCKSPENDREIRILFIGNSYTYFNSSPEVVKAMARERFPEAQVTTKLISAGGLALKDHWEDPQTIATIEEGRWDYVVLQEQSKLGRPIMINDDFYIGGEDRFFEYAEKFNTVIRASSAETVLLMTWSQRDKPEELALLTYAYGSLAKKLDAELAPVGLVWDALSDSSEPSLYTNDGRHPAPAGSYLLAATVFTTIFDESPVGLSEKALGHRLSSTGQASEGQYILIDIPKNQALSIQKKVKSVYDSLQANATQQNYIKPAPNYTIPVLEKSRPFSLDQIEGTWYGAPQYGSDYHAQVLEVSTVDGEPHARLVFYGPHGGDELQVHQAILSDHVLQLSFYDPIRQVEGVVSYTLIDGNLQGLLRTNGRLVMIKEMSLQRQSEIEQIDISKLVDLGRKLSSERLSRGYVLAAQSYYQNYSKLIGKSYKPAVYYLQGMAQNKFEQGDTIPALDYLELSTVYYPTLASYETYADGLNMAGKHDQAIRAYTQALELAKSSSSDQVKRLEENLKKLKENQAVKTEPQALPPPPPPPPSL